MTSMTSAAERLDAARLAGELRRSEAAELARAGDLDAAAKLLYDDGEPGSLDLLARVHAQRGAYEEAQAAWRRKLELVPDDPSAVEGLRLLEEITAGRRRRRPFPVVATAGAVAVLAVVGAGVGIGVGVSASGPEAIAPTMPAPLVPAPSLSSLPSSRPPSMVDDLMHALSGPGVHVESRVDGVSVVFDRGLFSPDATSLNSEGRAALARWGEKLRGQDVRVTVLGHSLAAGDGPKSGGSAIGIARASSAAGELSDVSGLPLTSFAVTTADQADTPYPDATDPARNRTVSLVVKPAR